MKKTEQFKKILNLSITLFMIALLIDYLIDGEFDIPLMMYHSILSIQHGSHLLPTLYISQLEQFITLFSLISINFNLTASEISLYLITLILIILVLIKTFIVLVNNYTKLYFHCLRTFKIQYITIRSALIPLP